MKLNISIFIGGVQKGSKRVSTPCLIGRSKSAALSVAHPAMSRIHCEIYEESSKLFLKDSGSLNGTSFKEQFVENPVELSLGSEFNVGELTFRITDIIFDSQKDEDIADGITVSEPIAPIPKKPNAGSTTVKNEENAKKDAKPELPPNSKKVPPKEVRIIT